MAVSDWAAREAMSRPSSIRNMPVTWKGDILPMVLSSMGAQPETPEGNTKTSRNFLKAIYDINKESTVQIFEITKEQYSRKLEIVLRSDMVYNTSKSIHERPLGACINLYFAEDVKRAACVLKKISFVAPRVPRPKRMGAIASRPFEHKIERLFEPFSFDCEVDIPRSTYEELVEGTLELQRHAQDQMNVEPKHTYVKRMRDELTKDVSSLLNNSQNQMRMGVVNVHLNHMATNSASVDMLSTWNEVGTSGDECWLSTTLDILVQKQLEQWLVREEDQPSAIKNIIKIFDENTSTSTRNAGLEVTVSKDDRQIPLGGVVMISGAASLNIPTVQMMATYKRTVRAFELKEQDYNTDRLRVEPNIAREAFPNYSMDNSVIVKEHNRDDIAPKEAEKKVASGTSINGNVTMLLTDVPEGVLLLDNVSALYTVQQDRDLDPLSSIMSHTTQSMWNMHHGYLGARNTSGEFQKSDQLSHVYMDTSTPDLYLNPTDKARQKISACMIKDSVFNDPYIYSSYFVECFNNMYKAAMKLIPTSPTRNLFTKCKITADKVYEDAHMWHAGCRNRGDVTSVDNGDMLMNELHPYYDAMPAADGGLEAYNRLVHGNIPLYIRPAATMLTAGQTLARKIWGNQYTDLTATIKNAETMAKAISAFFTASVRADYQAATHMLYSIATNKVINNPAEQGSKPDVLNPAALIQGLCGMPFISTGSLPKGNKYEWKDTASDLIVYLDVPPLKKEAASYSEEPALTRFFYTLADDERPGAKTFSYMIRPAFHELMKEIRTSSDGFAVKMCAMFCAWIRLTPEGTDFAFNYTRWPLAANVLTFKQDSTNHMLLSRPNSVLSLADMPITQVKRNEDKITIESTAHHRIASDGINPNSVIAPNLYGSSRTQSYAMIVSTLPTHMKGNIKVPDSSFTEAFAGYRKLRNRTMDATNRNKTKMGKSIISLTGEQLAWVCPPVVPSSAFQRPTNPTGRSSVPLTTDTPLVDVSVEIHDPSKYNGSSVSTLNPYATLPGGYVFCLHADPNGKVGEVHNCTYRNSRGASRAAHFFSPPQLLAVDKSKGSSLAQKIVDLPRSRRVLGDQDKFPTFIDGDSCNSSMNMWSESTGLAQHETYASNRFIYDNMISSRHSDSTYAAREVVWYNNHYAVPGHTFYAKNKTNARRIVSSG